MRIACIALFIFVAVSSFSASAGTNEPFGVATVPAPDHPLGIHWHKAQGDWTAERKILDQCRAEREHCPSREALQFLNIIDEARVRTGLARLAYINRAINLAIRPMSDLKNYGVFEIWTAPLATLANGAGDCTDYAIAKYFALGEAGISENERRLVVVGDRRRGGEHAVLAVSEEQHWLILDNQRMTIVDAIEANQYVSLLVLDHQGVRQVSGPVQPQMSKYTCVLNGG